MNLRMCNCPMCRAGRKSKWNKRLIKSIRHSARQRVKNLIRSGKYDEIPDSISVPYTD